ncbi:MAG TPA: hypothetical protein VHW26_03590 [Solirubrobacteraceae bacterium]|jgi:hypothetical protein|nr:hypothetical protein [Solirubrobacteraceae bacterium]
MLSIDSPPQTFHVLFAGGGAAALEAGLAVRERGADRFRITTTAPAR